MSDLKVVTTTQQPSQLDWIRQLNGAKPIGATISTTNLVEATHFPNGFIPPGTLLGIFTTGATEVGVWTPWVENGGAVGFEGENVIEAVVYQGFEVRKTAAGAILSTRTVGSIFRKNDSIVLIAAKMPTLLLTDDTTANPISNANLTAGGFTPHLGV